MSEDEDARAAAIDHYWDAIGRGERPADHIDPGLAETISRVHALADVPEPDPIFVAHLERTLVAGGRSRPVSGRVTPPGVPKSPNGTTYAPLLSPPALSPAVPRHRGAMAHLASAALLALTLVIGFVVFGPRSERIAAPAVFAPASWSSTLLVRVGLPKMPAGEMRARIDRWTLPARAGEWASTAASRPMLVYVETGSLTATVDAEAGLARAASFKGGAIPMPVDTEVPLRSGDLLVIPATTPFTLRTDGEEAPTLLVVVLQETPADEASAATAPPGITAQTLGKGNMPTVPSTATTVVLRRLEAGPRTTMPEEITAGPELLIVEDGSVRLGSGTNSPAVRQGVAGEASTTVPGGSRLALRNASNDPLVLLRLTVIPTR
jgi:mannose-6-phosphate isomerase-like protein (cupin superfamily)